MTASSQPALSARRRFLAPLAALLVGAFAMLFGAGVAAAHSTLISSDPDQGAQLSSSPEQVSLTFNEPLQDTFAFLTVVGPDDNYWHEGEPQIVGDTISVELRPLGPTGTYTMNYRVTSADGHPVEGQRSFELTVAGDGTPGPAVEDAGAEDGDGGIPLWPFILGAVVIIGGGLVAVLVFSGRGRSER